MEHLLVHPSRALEHALSLYPLFGDQVEANGTV